MCSSDLSEGAAEVAEKIASEKIASEVAEKIASVSKSASVSKKRTLGRVKKTQTTK